MDRPRTSRPPEAPWWTRAMHTPSPTAYGSINGRFPVPGQSRGEILLSRNLTGGSSIGSTLAMSILVMGPAARGVSVRFRVLVDGRPPGAAHGVDVDEQ